MPRSIKRKEHRLSMRLPETDIAIIDRAATLRGRSRTDFVRVIGGRALVVNAVDTESAEFWKRRGFVASKDDAMILFRSMADVKASIEATLR